MELRLYFLGSGLRSIYTYMVGTPAITLAWYFSMDENMMSMSKELRRTVLPVRNRPLFIVAMPKEWHRGRTEMEVMPSGKGTVSYCILALAYKEWWVWMTPSVSYTHLTLPTNREV